MHDTLDSHEHRGTRMNSQSQEAPLLASLRARALCLVAQMKPLGLARTL